ncbi:methionine--tRNA ligase [Streptomyces populi]|uniref:Methionine--tRNA ligase n=1 Tax=Streptomyces populi TaxID=2058924 RepID=A0A2I0SHB8_9ACTN|nr:class I tRNA ligase family protein [Streptomyces populi]PKT69316.1 methionine--tRNA ligase [Streptomyces populi]
MKTRTFDRDQMTWSYEMHLQPLLSAQDIPGLPFGSVFGSVPARTTSKRHAHQDGEIFFVLDGEAVVVLGDEERTLRKGESVHLTPFSFHEIRNESDEPFDLVSVYWDDAGAAARALDELPARSQLPERVRVFCPPPTPNGGLHLGHLAGPYVRADLFVRALRSMGRHARYVTGTDDHQSYVATAGRLTDRSPSCVAKEQGDGIVRTLHGAGVHTDRLTRPLADPDHTRTMSAWFDRLLASPAVTSRTEPTAYCATCDLSLFQAFARGTCADCAADSDGEICEACARPNQARDLKAVRCRICHTPATTREETALWLDLEHFGEALRARLKRIELSADLRAVVERLLDAPGGLAPYRLTRTGTWGSVVGDDPGQRLDPWADLAFTFLEASRAETERYGPADNALFLGLDNGYYYAVLLPALALAAGAEEHLPAMYVTNRFLQLSGRKFSTSRGHAVWADEALARGERDAVRASLLRAAPEGRETDMSREVASNSGDDPLYRAARAWLHGFADVRERHGDTVPGTGAWTVAQREFYRQLGSMTAELDGTLLPEAFSARGYVRLLDTFVERAEEFRVTQEPLRAIASQGEETRTSLALEYLAAKAFAALAWPVLPDLAQRVHDWLGLSGTPVRESAWTFLPSGTNPATASPLKSKTETNA